MFSKQYRDKSMKIEAIDKNFVVGRKIKGNVEYYEIPHSNFDLYGVQYDEKQGFFRMPLNIAKTVSEGVALLATNTSGGRIRFSTDSDLFELKVHYNGLWPMSHMTLVGQSGFVLLEETEQGRQLVKILPPSFTDEKGYTAVTELKGKIMRNYILYFPLYKSIKSLSIGLRKNAKVEKGKKYREIKPILYYGSSITQGGCASRPDNCYQALIEKWNNIDFINLGFSGNGKAEDNMVDYLSAIDCSLFVCDYDYNAPSTDYLAKTHYRLYERYRKVKPDTPILFLSRPDVRNGDDSSVREKIIRRTYKKAHALGDNKVYFISGRTFYDNRMYDNCSVDGCHPNDLGFLKMADKIYKKLVTINTKFQ